MGLDFEEVSDFHSNGVLHVRAEHQKRLVNLPQERQSGYTSDDVPQTGCDCGGMWQVKESESAGAPANDHVLWNLEKLTGNYMMAPEKVSGNSNIASVLSLSLYAHYIYTGAQGLVTVANKRHVKSKDYYTQQRAFTSY